MVTLDIDDGYPPPIPGKKESVHWDNIYKFVFERFDFDTALDICFKLADYRVNEVIENRLNMLLFKDCGLLLWNSGKDWHQVSDVYGVYNNGQIFYLDDNSGT